MPAILGGLTKNVVAGSSTIGGMVKVGSIDDHVWRGNLPPGKATRSSQEAPSLLYAAVLVVIMRPPPGGCSLVTLRAQVIRWENPESAHARGVCAAGIGNASLPWSSPTEHLGAVPDQGRTANGQL